MVKIKAFILSADFICLSASGYSFIDILETIISGNLALSGIENFIKLLFSMVGFVYLCVRIYHFTKKSSLERELLREDIIAKEIENHKNNTYNHFKSKLDEDNHENINQRNSVN